MSDKINVVRKSQMNEIYWHRINFCVYRFQNLSFFWTWYCWLKMRMCVYCGIVVVSWELEGFLELKKFLYLSITRNLCQQYTRQLDVLVSEAEWRLSESLGWHTAPAPFLNNGRHKRMSTKSESKNLTNKLKNKRSKCQKKNPWK